VFDFGCFASVGVISRDSVEVALAVMANEVLLVKDCPKFGACAITEVNVRRSHALSVSCARSEIASWK